MKVLVTGANGYIGQGVVKELLDRGCEVIATDFSLNNVDERATLITSNLFEVTDPYDTFEKPDVLVHLAWRDGFKHNSINHMNDLPKHFEFLKRMAEAGIKHMSVMGTMHEIGFWEGCIKEDTPTNPASLYGISKNALRECVELLAAEYGFVYQWLRGYYIVGNSKYGSSIFSKITDAESKGQEEFPFTMGQNQYDFIDYEELCAQIAVASIQTEVTGNINCCSGKPEKLADRVERFIKENGYKIKLAYGKYPDRPYDSKAVWGDATKIQQIMANAKEQ
jgi:dTDP-6-deoxy-L-talose 4-dehydrogenase (NAD+)